MVAEEPVKAAIWHALNSYCFLDAMFLAERLYAEVNSEEILHLLATCYYRSGHAKRAYNLLKNKTYNSIHNKYLFGIICYKLEKLREAEVSIIGICNPMNPKSPENLALEYGQITGVVMQLLGNIYRKSDCTSKAIQFYKHSLKYNAFLWSSYEGLCQMGEKVDPADYFKTSNTFKLSPQQNKGCPFSFHTPRNQISSLNENTPSENLDPAKAIPLLTSTVISKPGKDSTNCSRCNSDIEMPPPPPVTKTFPSGRSARQRILRSHASSSPVTPSFGVLQVESPANFGSSPMFITPPISSIGSKIPTKAPTKAPMKKVSHDISNSDSENISGIGLRRSTRLFGSTTTSRRTRVKFEDGTKHESPATRRLKSRVSRVSTCQPLTPTSQNILSTTSSTSKQQKQVEMNLLKDEKPSMPSPIQQSTDGLMSLLLDIGKAYQALTSYNCKKAITLFESLPIHQLSTCWVMEKIGMSLYEIGENSLAEKAFAKVRELDPFYIEEGMALYSSLLWLTRKDMLLSSLAQDLLDHDKLSPVTWCAMANCFSLQKEHDQAIKFLQRAIQVQPDFAYAYTLLGHEYVFTEELERALTCFRSSLRYNTRHYNAWYGIGMVYYKQEKFQLAEQHYQRALAINPKNSVLLCNLAVTQHDLGNGDLALETVTKASGLNPKNALCKYQKARVLLSLNREKESLTVLEELKQLEPKESLVYFMMGKAYQKLGETHLAQMNFSWALNLDPQGAHTKIKEAMNQQRFTTSVMDSTSQSNLDDEMSDLEESALQ